MTVLAALGATLQRMLESDSRRLRYLLVGVLNTVVGIVLGGGFYLLLHHWLLTPLISLLATAVSVSFSFVTLRRLVFRSSAPWWPQYLRCYAVYGATMAVTAAVVWALVDGLAVGIWWAQGAAAVLSVLLSYGGHVKFTFGGQSGSS